MSMEPVRLFSTLALAGVLRGLLPRLEAQGLAVETALSPTKVLQDRIHAGETADVAILTQEAATALVGTGVLRAGSQVDLARSHVGIAVRAGAPHPSIGTVEALRRLLIDTPSIAYSRAGASGLFFARLIEQMGLADMVNAKATVVPSGFTAERLVSGEVAIAVQQISELKEVSGVDIVGKLPDEIGSITIFSAAVFAASLRPEEAGRLVAALRSAGPLYEAAGLESLG